MYVCNTYIYNMYNIYIYIERERERYIHTYREVSACCQFPLFAQIFSTALYVFTSGSMPNSFILV